MRHKPREEEINGQNFLERLFELDSRPADTELHIVNYPDEQQIREENDELQEIF